MKFTIKYFLSCTTLLLLFRLGILAMERVYLKAAINQMSIGDSSYAMFRLIETLKNCQIPIVIGFLVGYIIFIMKENRK